MNLQILTLASVILLPVTFSVTPSDLACEGCHGVISELHEKLSKPTNSPPAVRVPKLMDKICKVENLVKYTFSPPKMVKACNELLGQHRTEVEKILISSFEKKVEVRLVDLEDEICFQATGSCVGIKDSPKDLLDYRQTVSADLVLNSDGRQELVFEKEGENLKLKQTDKDTDKSGKKSTQETTAKTSPKPKKTTAEKDEL